ncbi:MAG: D-amino-acid transaminase [Rhodospirillales bacterium]
MPRIAYVNGRYVRHQDACVHVEDRGYQFADGVYEVIYVADGALVDMEPHRLRLDRSLRELRIDPPCSASALDVIVRRVVAANRLRRGIVYLQATRGVAPREHAFPAALRTSLVVTARSLKAPDEAAARNGVAVVTRPDLRWKRPDIKSVALLPNILAKQEAREAGAQEAWLVGDGDVITEGSSTNAWIIDGDGTLLTHPADHAILNGVVRLATLRLARERGIKVVERPFTRAEALAAREAFLTSTTSFVMPVVAIDGRPVGNGDSGSTTLALREAYLAHLAASAAPR